MRCPRCEGNGGVWKKEEKTGVFGNNNNDCGKGAFEEAEMTLRYHIENHPDYKEGK